MEPRTQIRLGEIAHARSGDKGNHANVGVIAYTAAGFAYLEQVLTEARLAEYFLPLRPRQVTRYALPGLRAFNFVLQDVLGGERADRCERIVRGNCWGSRFWRCRCLLRETWRR